jgi:hypothetical protein
MAAAAEAISAIEGTCLGRAYDDDAEQLPVDGEALMCTVGSIKVHPNQVGSNIVDNRFACKQFHVHMSAPEWTHASLQTCC